MTTAVADSVTEEQIDGAKGLKIYVRSWRPAGAIRGVVAICHGLKSHGGYYVWAAEHLAATGLAVYVLDLHGRGKSEGDRFYVEEIGDYLTDINALVTLARTRESGKPVFLLGHSAGGVLSCVYALEHQAQLAGLICESFAFQVTAPDFALAAVKWLSHLVPRARVLRLKNEQFSRDPQAVRAMNNDPLITDEAQPAKTVAELARAAERLKREFSHITLPVLILHGTADNVTKPNGSRVFHDATGSRDKTLRLYEGHVHDLLNDFGREQVIDDIQQWISARLPSS